MASTSVRVSKETHDKIRDLAERTQKPMGDVIDTAIEQYRENQFWEETRRAYQRLREDPAAWNAYQNELKEWDATLLDGLENEPPYPKDESPDGA